MKGLCKTEYPVGQYETLIDLNSGKKRVAADSLPHRRPSGPRSGCY